MFAFPCVFLLKKTSKPSVNSLVCELDGNGIGNDERKPTLPWRTTLSFSTDLFFIAIGELMLVWCGITMRVVDVALVSVIGNAAGNFLTPTLQPFLTEMVISWGGGEREREREREVTSTYSFLPPVSYRSNWHVSNLWDLFNFVWTC